MSPFPTRRALARNFLLGGAAVLLVSVSLAMSCGSHDAKAEPYPRIAAYTGHQTVGRPLLLADGTPDTLLLRRLARFPMFTTEVAPWYSAHGPMRADVLQLLRRFGARRIIAYHLTAHWYLAPTFVPQASDQSFPASWHRAIASTNGWLWTTTGVVKPYYEVDWSRRATADTLCSLLCGVARSGMFDGMFLDCFSWQIAWASGGSNPPADLARAGWFSYAQMDSARQANMRRTVERIHDAGGPGFSVMFNGTGEQPWTDGGFREGFPDQLTTFDQARLWAEFAGAEGWLQAGSGYSNVTTADAQRAARFSNGTACVIGVRSSFGPDRHWEYTPYYGTWWPAEFSVVAGMPDTTGAGVGWLGDPLGAGARLSSGLWRRDFWGGCVVVNPGGSTLSFTIPPGMSRLGGVTGTGTVSVPARDAVFLVRR